MHDPGPAPHRTPGTAPEATEGGVRHPVKRSRRSRGTARFGARRSRLLSVMQSGGGAFDRTEPAVRSVCRIVRQLVAELLALASDRQMRRRNGRRAAAHVRQIAMYVCHVALQISFVEIAAAFGRDRTTVSHACNAVEDRRDDCAFDDFVATVERIALSIFASAGAIEHE
ncbi:helix-turn-helix domain-containing protein [Mycoplana rhizolycopersici]